MPDKRLHTDTLVSVRFHSVYKISKVLGTISMARKIFLQVRINPADPVIQKQHPPGFINFFNPCALFVRAIQLPFAIVLFPYCKWYSLLLLILSNFVLLRLVFLFIFLLLLKVRNFRL